MRYVNCDYTHRFLKKYWFGRWVIEPSGLKHYDFSYETVDSRNRKEKGPHL
jgi:hypothetical protein